jgi:hypothetical protein
MKNYEIIRTLATWEGTKKLWNTFSRYILILDNHLHQRPLSAQEAKNHQGNEARVYYLNLLVQGFGLKVDYNSPLFENRLNSKNQRFFWSDDSDFYLRFFERLKFFQAQNLPINEQTLKEMLTMGSLAFNPKYKFPADKV